MQIARRVNICIEIGREEVKSRLNSRNVGYYSFHSLLSSHTLSRRALNPCPFLGARNAVSCPYKASRIIILYISIIVRHQVLAAASTKTAPQGC